MDQLLRNSVTKAQNVSSDPDKIAILDDDLQIFLNVNLYSRTTFDFSRSKHEYIYIYVFTRFHSIPGFQIDHPI